MLPVGATGVVPHPQRRRLPDDRTEVGRKFKVGDYEGYIHVGLFEDGTPGDIFVDIAKEGTTLAGLMNSFMISVSLGLQYGVPLDVYVSKFSHMRFEPSGLTNDADIRVAKSIVDYIFRWMGKKFLSADQQEEAGILTPEVKARLAAAYTENPGAGAAAQAVESAPPGQTALFNQWEDAVECAPLRRPHGQDGLVLHVSRLRHEHGLQLRHLLIGCPERAAETRLSPRLQLRTRPSDGRRARRVLPSLDSTGEHPRACPGRFHRSFTLAPAKRCGPSPDRT